MTLARRPSASGFTQTELRTTAGIKSLLGLAVLLKHPLPLSDGANCRRMAHRIEIDNTRAPLIAKLFDWYATGECSLRAVTAKAYAACLTHPRSGRPMMKAEIHPIVQNPIYTGDFQWQGSSFTARTSR